MKRGGASCIIQEGEASSAGVIPGCRWAIISSRASGYLPEDAGGVMLGSAVLTVGLVILRGNAGVVTGLLLLYVLRVLPGGRSGQKSKCLA